MSDIAKARRQGRINRHRRARKPPQLPVKRSNHNTPYDNDYNEQPNNQLVFETKSYEFAEQSRWWTFNVS